MITLLLQTTAFCMPNSTSNKKGHKLKSLLFSFRVSFPPQIGTKSERKHIHQQ